MTALLNSGSLFRHWKGQLLEMHAAHMLWVPRERGTGPRCCGAERDTQHPFPKRALETRRRATPQAARTRPRQ